AGHHRNRFLRCARHARHQERNAEERRSRRRRTDGLQGDGRWRGRGDRRLDEQRCARRWRCSRQRAFRPSGATRWLTPEPPGNRVSTRRALESRRCSIKEVMSFLWAIVWRFRWRTLGTILLLVIAKIAAVLVPLALKAIVDHFSATKGGGESGVSISSDLI